MPIRYPLDIATFNRLTVSASSTTAALTVEQLSGATGDLLSIKSGTSVVGSISNSGVATLPRVVLNGNLTNIAIQPSATEYAADTKIMDIKRKDNTQLMWVDAEGDMYIKGDLIVEGTTQYSDTQHIAGDLTVNGNIILEDSTGAYVLKAVNTSGAIVNLEVSSDVVLTSASQTIDGVQIATHDHSGAAGKGAQISYASLTNKPSSGSWNHDTTVNGSRLWTTGTNTTIPYHISQNQGKIWNDHMSVVATAAASGHIKVGTGLDVTSGTVSVKYGTAAGTACQGNDARLSDARTPLTHQHPGSEITTAVAQATNADTVDGQHASAFAPASHPHAAGDLPAASTTAVGVVQLSTSTSSTSTTQAATPSAVKEAYDKGNHSHPYLPTAGGTMTGPLNIRGCSIVYNATEQSLDFIFS